MDIKLIINVVFNLYFDRWCVLIFDYSFMNIINVNRCLIYKNGLMLFYVFDM